MDTEEGKEFVLAGWGLSGEVKEDGNQDHLDDGIFHRGYNKVNEIVDNMLVYTMDKPEDGGLDLEAMGHNGDSGSPALIYDDEKY